MPGVWPEELLDFAFLPEINDRLAELAGEAETEDWEYHRISSPHPRPVLYNYVRQTYHRLAEEGKLLCLATGSLLVSIQA